MKMPPEQGRISSNTSFGNSSAGTDLTPEPAPPAINLAEKKLGLGQTVWRVRGRTSNGHSKVKKYYEIILQGGFPGKEWQKRVFRELRGTGEEENRRGKSVSILSAAEQ